MSQPRPNEEKMDIDSEVDLSAAGGSGSSATGSAAASISGAVPPSAVPPTKPSTSGESRNVMAGSATVPSVTCSLHPLVIMNISDHWTRIRAQKGFKSQVYGALIGKQKGRNIEVMNSFELKFDLVDDEVHILMDYYNTKEEQCKI